MKKWFGEYWSIDNSKGFPDAEFPLMFPRQPMDIRTDTTTVINTGNDRMT